MCVGGGGALCLIGTLNPNDGQHVSVWVLVCVGGGGGITLTFNPSNW